MDDWDLFEEIDIEDISTLIALGVADQEHGSKAPRTPTKSLQVLQCQYLHQQGIIIHKTLQNSSLLITSSSLMIMGSDKYSKSHVDLRTGDTLSGGLALKI